MTGFDRLAQWALTICSDAQIAAEHRRRQRRAARLRHPSSGDIFGPSVTPNWNRKARR